MRKFVKPTFATALAVVALLVLLAFQARRGALVGDAPRETYQGVMQAEPRRLTALPIPTGLRIEVVAREAESPAPSELLLGLDSFNGAQLASAVQRGFAPGAGWPEKLLAAEALRMCRGYLRPDPASLQLLAGRAAAANLQENLHLRLQRCQGLQVIDGAVLAREEVRLIQALEGEGSPMVTSLLTRVGIGPASTRDIERTRAELRETVAIYGTVAIGWHKSAFARLARLDGAGDSGHVLELAAELAACSSNSACGKQGSLTLDLCAQSGVCTESAMDSLLSFAPDAASAERAKRLAEELAQATQQKDWKRLGLSPH